MKNKFKKFNVLGALSLVMGYASMASAHDIPDATLGSAAGATDFYQVSCQTDGFANGTQRLDIYVRDDTPGLAVLSLQVQKGYSARNTTDAKGADGYYGPKASITGGAGIYNVLVNKRAAGARRYDISLHCMNGTNHTTTTWALRQNN